MELLLIVAFKKRELKLFLLRKQGPKKVRLFPKVIQLAKGRISIISDIRPSFNFGVLLLLAPILA